MSDRPYFHSLALDRAEPRRNADFYCELLGYQVVEDDGSTPTRPATRSASAARPGRRGSG